MNNEYIKSRRGLQDTVEVIEDNISDLTQYSVYHDDVLEPEIKMIESALRSIRYKELQKIK